VKSVDELAKLMFEASMHVIASPTTWEETPNRTKCWYQSMAISLVENSTQVIELLASAGRELQHKGDAA
jgi:hypothetical protein